MTAQSPFDAGGQFAWDSTSLGWAETCLRLYKYSMIDTWRAAVPSVHLWFGGHYATALEHFHKHRADGDDRETALRFVVLEVLTATWGDEGPIDFDHPSKTRANLLRTIIWYIDHFEEDPLETVILSNGKAAVEYSFTLEFSNELVYCGHIDRLVQTDNHIYVQDQKTTGGTLSPSYFSKFDPDTQMSGYAWAGKIIYNQPIHGVVIDAAQVAVGFSRFERGFTFRTPAKLDEWHQSSLYHMNAARQAFQEDFYPMNRSSCDKYGGCPFRKICSKSPEVREQFLKADFVKRSWNPLESR